MRGGSILGVALFIAIFVVVVVILDVLEGTRLSGGSIRGDALFIAIFVFGGCELGRKEKAPLVWEQVELGVWR